MQQQTFGIHKMQGISPLAVELLATHGGVSSMQFKTEQAVCPPAESNYTEFNFSIHHKGEGK